MDDFDPAESQTPESFLIFSLILEMGLGGVALLLGLFLGPDPRTMVPMPEDWLAIAKGLGIGTLAALPLLGVVQLLEHLPLKPIKELRKLTEEKLLKLMKEMRAVDLAGISICAGVGEELLFRGWLFMALAGPASEWTPALLILPVIGSSIAFGFAHPVSPAYIVVTGLIGVYMAILLIVTGNLLVPIAAHAFYDFLQLILATREMRKQEAGGAE